MKKFNGHWYPEKPTKGSAYRCISIENQLDAVLIKAVEQSRITVTDLSDCLPKKLDLWIDPAEVSYRIGKSRQTRLYVLSWQYTIDSVYACFLKPCFSCVSSASYFPKPNEYFSVFDCSHLSKVLTLREKKTFFLCWCFSCKWENCWENLNYSSLNLHHWRIIRDYLIFLCILLFHHRGAWIGHCNIQGGWWLCKFYISSLEEGVRSTANNITTNTKESIKWE